MMNVCKLFAKGVRRDVGRETPDVRKGGGERPDTGKSSYQAGAWRLTSGVFPGAWRLTPNASPFVLALALLAAGCANEGRTIDLSPEQVTRPVVRPALARRASPTAALPATDGHASAASPARDAPPADARPPGARREDAIPGMLVADRKAAIGSQLTGQITAVLVAEGDRVRANQVVIRLDDRALRLEVASSAAALEAARRRLTSGATGTQVTANEVEQLVTQAHGDLQVSLARRDAARAALDSAAQESAAEIAAARAQLDAADARLTRLRNGSRPQELAVARAGVRADEARLTRAADEAKRMQDLFQQGAVSEQALVAATSEQRRLEAELAHSQQQLALVEEGSRKEEIGEAEAQRRAAEAQLHVAEGSRQRVEQRRSELAAAQAQVDHAQSALRVARDSHVRVARSRQDADSLAGDLRLASANLAIARERLNQAVLRSPIDGQVTRRQVQPGDSVTADQRVLLEVTDTSSLHAEIAISEAELPRLRVGMPVWMELPSQPGRRLPGRIESLGAAPRGNAPGYVGRVRLSHLPPQARAGMLANLYLQPK